MGATASDRERGVVAAPVPIAEGFQAEAPHPRASDYLGYYNTARPHMGIRRMTPRQKLATL